MTTSPNPSPAQQHGAPASARGPLRLVLLIVGLLIALTAIGGATLGGIFSFGVTTNHESLVHERFERIVVDIPMGSVTIREDARLEYPSVRIESENQGFFPGSSATTKTSNGVLQITAERPFPLAWTGGGENNITITLPTRSGDVLEQVRVDNEVGDIRIETHIDSVDVESRVGDVRVSALQSAATSSIRVATEIGSVSIEAVPGSYRILADSDFGKVSVSGLTNDPSEDRIIDVVSQIGDVSVRAER
ncbi:DUF4097 family beta strand repeat-containing protein [Lysinibacter sp. HNR]|uniref:DUF4097 family beta strand repeat-containing protein n=1 Tax=Lysinibacter sp. HNR TaxID=3031408 RepID=UPI0024350161|nr:DUF4097 family beta strand repeat-containing protein [Lysinibacter sp. HNR]WGD37004.1 DUF4097 family beta strand repeat-containing protein [Lysinibacter sp. HNR]